MFNLRRIDFFFEKFNLKKMIHNFHIDVFINLNIHKFDARHLFF